MHRALFVESYPHVIYGQQRTLLSLLDQCTEAGIQPSVAVTGEGPFVEAVESRGVPVLRLPYPDSLASYGGAIYRTHGLTRLRVVRQLVGYVRTIRAALRRQRVEAVFCNDMRGLLTAGVAARSSGVPVMIWDKLDKPHGWMDLLQLPLSSRNLIISDAVRCKYPHWQQRAFHRKILKIYNGVDLERFERPAPVEARLPAEAGDVLIALVGSITPRKGHDRILGVWEDIAVRCPQARLLIVGGVTGSPEDDGFLKSLPCRDHPRVHFLGMREDVPAILNSVDLLVVPSRHEGMGQVTVEGMACGLPVIGADTGGIPEVVVDRETGVIVDGNSPEAIIEAVVHLAESPELRRRMGEAGRARVRAYFDRSVQMRRVLNEFMAMI